MAMNLNRDTVLWPVRETIRRGPEARVTDAPLETQFEKTKPPFGLNIFLASVCVFGFLSAFTQIATAADRIKLDSQCLTIDGKDTYIFSGAFHYFRCPKELWHDRFAKMKLAGCNAVETYVAWNYHEPNKPMSLDDYSQCNMKDLEDFIRMAEDDFGLYVILRPGPYICAEWDNGGYPRWLSTLKPDDFKGSTWLRGDEPFYLAWCRHWYTAVAKVAKPHLLTNRPPGKTGVILWQLENEYDYGTQDHDDIKRHQILALAHDARDLGIDVPLFTCVTKNANYRADPFLNANVYDTVNSYPGFNMDGHRAGITAERKYQPDKLLGITEQQGGWFSGVGGALSADQGYTDKQITLITLTSMSQGITSMNYYMFFGGTNLGDTAAHSITTTYDYNAPIREWGGVDKRFQAVRAIGLMLKEQGPKLCRAVEDHTEVLTSDDKDVKFWVRRATDGSRYIFVDTEQGKSPRKGTAKLRFENGDETVVNYDLEPWDFKILYMPTDSPPVWLPKPAPPIERPDASQIPGPIKITEAVQKDDAGPATFKPREKGQLLEDAGIYSSQFVYYRSTLSKGGAPIPADGLSITPHMSASDTVIAKIGDQIIIKPTNKGELLHLDAKQIESPVQVTLLYENTGHDNGGPAMETKKGITGWRITGGASAPHAINDWRMKVLPSLTDASSTASDFDDSSWQKADVNQANGNLTENQAACYRATVDLGDADPKAKPMQITFGMIDDIGTIYVNGTKIGEAHDWSEPQTFNITAALKPGKNVIAVLVQNQAGNGGLAKGVGMEAVADSSPVTSTWEISDQPQGVAEKWWSPKLDESGWNKITLSSDAAATPPKSLLTWYRMKFDLPAAKPSVWYPWKIKLEGTGNGFVYLNNHPIGRYWQVGPQREYFLPECWLNFGPGKTNVVTLSLRPTPEGAALKSAEVSPYAEWAEKR